MESLEMAGTPCTHMRKENNAGRRKKEKPILVVTVAVTVVPAVAATAKETDEETDDRIDEVSVDALSWKRGRIVIPVVAVVVVVVSAVAATAAETDEETDDDSDDKCTRVLNHVKPARSPKSDRQQP